MIARNEERMLPACLASVRGLVDEVVLVDTGSTDATRELATGLGARVYQRPWDDDFAAPRNLAIERAVGDWILVLDADERLAPGGARAIRRAMKRSDLDLGLLRLHNASRLDATDAEILGATARLGEASHVPRLLRHTSDLRYQGLVHESVAEWVAARGLRLDAVDADILHLGGAPALREALGKSARNVALLEKRCRLEPGSVVPLGYLAMEHWDAGRVEEARALASRGWDLLEAQPRYHSAHLVGAVRGFCQVRAGDGPGLAETVARMVEREGPRRDFAFLGAVAVELGALRQPGPGRRAALEAALRAYREVMGATYPPEERTFVAGATTWSARIRAGTLLLQLGRPDEALGEFGAALDQVPGSDEAVLGAAEASLDRGDVGAATSRLGPLLERGHARPDGWLLAAAASIQATGSLDGAAGLLARARALEATGWIAAHRAGRLRAIDSPLQPDPSSELLAALMERRPVPAEAVGATIGEGRLRAVAQTLLRTGRAGLLEPLLSPAAAEASPGLPERVRALLEELDGPSRGAGA
jgi:tetratricopeptide (TPR) repeat protein